MEASRAEGRFAMNARTGDRIVVDSAHVGQPRREGEVLEVRRGEGEHQPEHYRVFGSKASALPHCGPPKNETTDIAARGSDLRPPSIRQRPTEVHTPPTPLSPQR